MKENYELFLIVCLEIFVIFFFNICMLYGEFIFWGILLIILLLNNILGSN